MQKYDIFVYPNQKVKKKEKNGSVLKIVQPNSSKHDQNVWKICPELAVKTRSSKNENSMPFSTPKNIFDVLQTIPTFAMDSFVRVLTVF